MERPDWKEPPLHEGAQEARTRLSMLEAIQIMINGMNTQFANVENLLETYLYRNPMPYSCCSLEYSASSPSSQQVCTAANVPTKALITVGEGEVNNSVSVRSVTPEVEYISRDQSTPEM